MLVKRDVWDEVELGKGRGGWENGCGMVVRGWARKEACQERWDGWWVRIGVMSRFGQKGWMEGTVVD